MRVELELPTSLPSVANLREHWTLKAKRAKKLRGDVYLVLRTSRRWMQAAAAARARGASITLTRIALGPRLDDDNLTAALKPIRDGVADALGIDDGDPRLLWKPEQNTGHPDRVRVTLEVPEGFAR